jgi:hypothetical protein
MWALQPTKNAKKVIMDITKIKWEEVTQFLPNSLSSCALNSSSVITVDFGAKLGEREII